MPKGNVYLGRRFEPEEAKEALKASEEGRFLYEKPKVESREEYYQRMFAE